MTEARAEILGSIRRHLGRAEGDRVLVPPRGVEPTPGAPTDLSTQSARLGRFRELLERVRGRVAIVGDEDEARAELARIVAEHGAEDVALSDSPLVARIADGLGSVRTFDGWSDRARLLDCDLGVTSAQWGIAETGTIVLESKAEKHRIVSLVPPVHVAVLEAENIVVGLGDALQKARDGESSHALSLITGPSRTADIELTIVVGVHGPEVLHVIVIDRTQR